MNPVTLENIRSAMLLFLCFASRNRIGCRKPAERFAYRVFINAWNEWNEQAVLQPTDKSGYDMLNLVSDVILHT